MHAAKTYATLLALTTSSLAAIKVENFIMDVGGTWGAVRCRTSMDLDRGNTPLNFSAEDECSAFQDGGKKFEMDGDIEIHVHCSSTRPAECAQKYTVEVKTPDGECASGKVERTDDPADDFKKAKRSYPPPTGLAKRQDYPSGDFTRQYYADTELGSCDD
ncbi:hypothetical protein Q7P37_006989 [Cladosporium fusiforme]